MTVLEKRKIEHILSGLFSVVVDKNYRNSSTVAATVGREFNLDENKVDHREISLHRLCKKTVLLKNTEEMNQPVQYPFIVPRTEDSRTYLWYGNRISNKWHSGRKEIALYCRYFTHLVITAFAKCRNIEDRFIEREISRSNYFKQSKSNRVTFFNER